MKKKSTEFPSTPEPQGGHYNSVERQVGLARLAMHTTFEQVMRNSTTNAEGVARMERLAPHILRIVDSPFEADNA